MDGIEWSDSRRVDCVLCIYLPHDIMMQASIVYLSLKTAVDGIEWLDSRRVDCILFTTIYHRGLA